MEEERATARLVELGTKIYELALAEIEDGNFAASTIEIQYAETWLNSATGDKTR